MTDKSPIFVIGVDRSGTTLLRLMLDSHSKISIPYESHFFIRFYRRRESFGDLEEEQNRRKLVEEILEQPYVNRWDQQITIDELDLDKCISLEATIDQIYSAYARRFGKEIWGDKTPEYVDQIDVLNNMYPNARFIHIIRDGRDVGLSILKRWWGADDFVTVMRYWVEKVTLARKMLGVLPENRSIEIRFEDLVVEPEKELRRVASFLGLSYEEGMVAEYTQGARGKVSEGMEEDRNSYHKHLTSAPSVKQAYKWTKALSPADQAIAHEIAGPLLTELGYTEGVAQHPLKILRKGYHRIVASYRWRMRRLAGSKTE